MKKYINALIILSTFAQLQLFCNAGLLDLLIRGERRLLNRNHDGNIDLNDQFNTGIPNNAANTFYPEYNNWRSPISTSNPRDYVNKMNEYNNRAPDIPSQLGNVRMPFTNRNNEGGQALSNDFAGNNENFNNKLINSNVQAGNNPANREKIMNDIKKINSILEVMRKQNVGNSNTASDSNGREFNRYPSYNHQTQPNFPTVHINNRVSDGRNNENNVNEGDLPFISNTLHYNKPTSKPITNQHPATNSNLSTEKPVKVYTSAVITEPDGNSNPTPKPNLSHPSTKKHTTTERPKAVDEKYVLKPITKSKFFVQVEPIIPDDKFVRHNETVYYIDKK